MDKCKNGCTYSRAMDQEYPRKCVHCGKPEEPIKQAPAPKTARVHLEIHKVLIQSLYVSDFVYLYTDKKEDAGTLTFRVAKGAGLEFVKKHFPEIPERMIEVTNTIRFHNEEN